LKMALETLGFGPAYHIQEMLERQQLPMWDVPGANYTTKEFPVKPDFRAIFEPAGFKSGIDVPMCFFWREILEEYGDTARVILTDRDPGAWYDSCYSTIYKHDGLPEDRKLAYESVPELKQLWDWEVKTHWSPWNFANRSMAILAYEQYKADVRATVPKHQLLEFDNRQGWKPLCDFLGVPVPDVPYPHVNDKATQLGHAKKIEELGAAYRAAREAGLSEESTKQAIAPALQACLDTEL